MSAQCSNETAASSSGEVEGTMPMSSIAPPNAVKSNDILKMLAETCKSLKPFQAFDNSVYVMISKSQETDLIQFIQAVNGRPHRLVPGHEKDVVHMDELMSAIKTHANQVTLIFPLHLDIL